MHIVLSPHHDDAVLFASFTVLRERALVINVLDSYVQPMRGYPNCDNDKRASEDRAAIGILGGQLQFLPFRDDHPDWDGIRNELIGLLRSNTQLEVVYAPYPEPLGHDHHNRLGEIAGEIFHGQIRYYLTYTKKGKSTGGVRVPYRSEWALRKLRALACYDSQISLENCTDHFLREQYEYYAE